MKKLIAMCILILPMAVFAQKKTGSVSNFFEEYSEIPEYESMEVTEDMFKMFTSIEDAEPEMVEFLSKLKSVRYLEYQGSGKVVVGISSSGTGNSKGTASYYYVDGKQVASTGGSKKGNSKNSGNVITTGKATGNLSTFNPTGGSVLYNRAMDEIDLKSYTQLMKSNQDGEKMIFLKREWSSEDKEFLMLNGNKLINIRGDINIMHLYEFEDILSSIGEILEFEIPY